jgi:hypothetical protein
MQKENECSCDTCKNMCKKCPCIGTPEDILNIINAGYGYGLSNTTWLTGMAAGEHNAPVQMIQPLKKDNGCAFLDDSNLCILHDLGLKPTEGKISNHADTPVNSFKETINYKVAMTWIDENGKNDPVTQLMNVAVKQKKSSIN